MLKYMVDGGAVAGVLARFAALRKAETRPGRCYLIIVIQEAGLDSF